MNLASARRYGHIAPPHATTATTTRRLGMAAPACLGVTSARLVAEGHCRGFGRQLRCGLSMAQAPAGGRRGGAAHPAAAWADPALEGGAAGPAARPVGARGRGVGLPGRRLDGAARGGGHLAHGLGALPPPPCQPPLAAGRLDAAPAGAASPPAERGSASAVGCRALARPAKKAHAEGRTIVCRDESGFSLLPHAVRTGAPRGQTPVLHVPLPPDHRAAIRGQHPGWASLYADAPRRLRRAWGRGVPARAAAQAAGHGPRHLGRIAPPPGAPRQGLSRAL